MIRLIAIKFLLLFVLQSTVYGQGYSFADSSLVEHPVFHPTESGTASAWKRDLGGFFEGLVHLHLEKLDRFQEVYEIKNPRNNGIDRIAIRRGADGKIIDVRFIEVKTKNPKPILATTKDGVQLSDGHLRAKLDEYRKSGVGEMQKLVQKLGFLAEVTEEVLSSYILRRHNELWEKLFEPLKEDDKVKAVKARVLRTKGS